MKNTTTNNHEFRCDIKTMKSISKFQIKLSEREKYKSKHQTPYTIGQYRRMSNNTQRQRTQTTQKNQSLLSLWCLCVSQAYLWYPHCSEYAKFAKLHMRVANNHHQFCVRNPIFIFIYDRRFAHIRCATRAERRECKLH